jgi:hypothetical protein
MYDNECGFTAAHLSVCASVACARNDATKRSSSDARHIASPRPSDCRVGRSRGWMLVGRAGLLVGAEDGRGRCENRDE